MKLQCLNLSLQKSNFSTKAHLGTWVTQDTAQLSVTATQMDTHAIYTQDSKHINRHHIPE